MNSQQEAFIKKCLATYEKAYKRFASVDSMKGSFQRHAREYTRAVHETELPTGLHWKEVDQVMRHCKL